MLAADEYKNLLLDESVHRVACDFLDTPDSLNIQSLRHIAELEANLMSGLSGENRESGTTNTNLHVWRMTVQI